MEPVCTESQLTVTVTVACIKPWKQKYGVVGPRGHYVIWPVQTCSCSCSCMNHCFHLFNVVFSPELPE